MIIDRAFAIANQSTRLQFLAMERSLRATGCDVPLFVIPYSDDIFDLPQNCEWHRPPLRARLIDAGGHPITAKYHCLAEGRHFYTDSDIIFLRNPVEWVADLHDLVAADTDWNKPKWTYTKESAALLGRRSSVWLRNVFNSGFFALEHPLYSADSLFAAATSPEFRGTCLPPDAHEQPGINLLAAATGVPITNLTLPPHLMESTWAGDYPGEFQSLWSDPARKPGFIHWAGPVLDDPAPIHELFYGWLTRAERQEWDKQQADRRAAAHRRARWPLGVRALNAVVRAIDSRFYVQRRPVS